MYFEGEVDSDRYLALLGDTEAVADIYDFRGPPPIAENDFGTTQEETPITIYLLANDRAGNDDDDDDDDFRIDRGTVDLNPDLAGRQSSLNTPQGVYGVDRDGTLTFSPALNFFGNSSIQYTVDSRAGETSNRATISFTVSNVNDAPVIANARRVPIQAQAGQPTKLSIDDVIISDPDNQSQLDFVLEVLAGTNYQVSGTEVTPSSGFSGELPVQVRVSDGAAFSTPFTLTLLVTEENVPPSITGQAASITTLEDQSIAILVTHVTISDPDDAYPEGFTIEVGEGTNYTVSGQTVIPLANFFGTLTVPVVVNDGESNSNSFPLTISVTAVNDPPVITGQSPLATQEDTPLTISLSNITATDVDNEYPTGFTFSLQPGANYSVAGDVITPAPDYAGSLIVPAIVNDGGNDSNPFDLQITVHPVNDVPVITGQVPLTIGENASLELNLSHLTVLDADGQYPEGYTLSVLGGTNYSVSGNVITPAFGFNGVLDVQVFVNDGTASSGPFHLSITVSPTNDPPVITGHRPLEVNEDTPITLSLQDLTVTDPDNTFPEGFTLVVQPGEYYTLSGTSIIPAADFAGTLAVNVIVSDGVSNSNPFAVQISVLPQNDAPVITGQNAVTTNEDGERTITFEDLLVTDPDNTYPSGFSLVVSPGENYTLSGNTVIPSPNFSGNVAIQVQVSDGLIGSNIYSLSMTVLPVNDVPVITGQVAVQTAEDTPVTIQLSDLTVLDVDNVYPAGFALVVSPGSNYTVSASTVTPVANFNGTLNVGVMVYDGVANSPSFLFQIQVGNANDPPAIAGQAVVSTNEETPFEIALSHLTVFDPDNAFPTGFSLIVSPGVNYSVSGQTVVPALNFAGILTIPVRVNDGVNNSASFDFKLQVNQVNDAPSFAAIPNQQVAENSPVRTVTISGISKGPLEDYQLLTFVVTSGNTAIIENPAIQYNGAGPTAVLSYVVKPNTSGLVTLTIVAIDNGSNAAPNVNSYSSSFQVEVLEINSAPTLSVINDITLLEDAEQQNVALSGITAGPGETQSLSIAVTASKPDVFDLLGVAYTTPENTGLLQFKTKANVFGTVQLSVTVTDNGSGVAPHLNTITRVFTLVIQPVNDPPVFTSVPLTVAVVNESYSYAVTASDPDGDAIVFSASVKPAWANLSGSNKGTATLTGIPPAAALGNTPITLHAKDAAVSVEQSFSIYVNVRPGISSLTLATQEDTPVSLGAELFASAYTDANENAMASIQVTSLPATGRLFASEVEVKAGDTLSISLLSGLTYAPDQDYFGSDTFGWKAFDGYHFSAAASVQISVLSVNDPPEIIFQSDTVMYEINDEPPFVAPLADIIDPDDDTLTHAAIGFRAGSFRADLDLLEFQNTANVRGNFNLQSGVLAFSGTASIAEYRTALRSVRYVHLNTTDPLLTPKVLSFTLHDGEAESVPKDKVIMLQYSFVEFEIPSGFTPNGDNSNDTWVIDRPGGGLDEMDNAIVSVYDKQGVLVYRRKGFDQAWDGTMDGKSLPADSYFFTIDLQLRNRKTYKGIVTILR